MHGTPGRRTSPQHPPPPSSLCQATSIRVSGAGPPALPGVGEASRRLRCQRLGGKSPPFQPGPPPLSPPPSVPRSCFFWLFPPSRSPAAAVGYSGSFPSRQEPQWPCLTRELAGRVSVRGSSASSSRASDPARPAEGGRGRAHPWSLGHKHQPFIPRSSEPTTRAFPHPDHPPAPATCALHTGGGRRPEILFPEASLPHVCSPTHPKAGTSLHLELRQGGGGQVREDSRDGHAFPSCCPFSLEGPFLPLAAAQTQLNPTRLSPRSPHVTQVPPTLPPTASSLLWSGAAGTGGQGPSRHDSGKMMCKKVQAPESGLGSPLAFQAPGAPSPAFQHRQRQGWGGWGG